MDRQSIEAMKAVLRVLMACKTLVGQSARLHLGEINSADMECSREAALRGDSLMVTLNPGDPSLIRNRQPRRGTSGAGRVLPAFHIIRVALI